MKITRLCIGAGERIVGRLASRNYHFAEVHYDLCFHFSGARYKEPLLVFRMGKVGSTRVVRLLEAAGVDVAVYHAHVLAQEAMAKVEKAYRRHFAQMSLVPHHLWKSQYLRKQIDRGQVVRVGGHR